MPLVSRMLLARRGTRGKPCFPSTPSPQRYPGPDELLRKLAETIAQLPIQRPELGLPLLSRDFAEVLLDPKAGQRADLPAIPPAAAIEILLELQRLRRVECSDWMTLDERLETLATHVHFGMSRYLCARSSSDGPCALVEPNLEPRRWLSGALCYASPIAAALLDALRSATLLALERDLREPVTRRRSVDGRWVHIDMLRCVRYRLDRREHRTVAELYCVGSRMEPVLMGDASLLEPAPISRWLPWYLLRGLPVLREVVAAVDLLVDEQSFGLNAVSRWLSRSVQAQLRRAGVARHLRRALRRAVPHDPIVIEVAWRARLDRSSPPTCAALDQVETHRADYLELLRSNPRLLHLSAVAARNGRGHAPTDLQQLKHVLRECGASHNAWRLLCRHGLRVYAAALDERRYRHEPLTLIAEVANLIIACQRPGLPPPELLQHLVAVYDQNPDENPTMAPAELLRAAWDATRAMDRSARRLFVRDSFARALAWRYDATSEVLIPAGAPWQWFDTRAARWEARCRVVRAGGTPWARLIESFEHNGIRVVPLDTSLALWDEACAMRHCLARRGYAARCRLGQMQIYSLRDATTGKRLATLSLSRSPQGRWKQREMAGFANGAIPRADLGAAAQAVLERVVQASSRQAATACLEGLQLDPGDPAPPG